MLHCKNREEQPMVFKQPTLTYPVTLQKLPNGRGSFTDNWTPVPMLDLRRFKEARVSYGIPSPYMKQMLNSWFVIELSLKTEENWLKVF